MKGCVVCGGKKQRASYTYCSNVCQQDFQMMKAINAGTQSAKTAKRYLLSTEPTCRDCGVGSMWNSKPLVLELEHIDGNSENNDLSNLCLLCPNCHSQTDTYKAKNRGSGRHSRRQRYADGKSY